MKLERVFELIRKEDVTLWIGSGFSLYAGYPTGKALAQRIYDSLSAEDRLEISAEASLSDLAEQFVRLHGDSRNQLNTILKKEFTKNAGSLKWHELLAKISHIKTIITTNYDRLFESAYKHEIHPIVKPSDIAYRDNKTELFKIHGDIFDFDSIVITRTDYTNFFKNNTSQNLIWNTVKERISNKNVIFIGYDLEDENIKMILQELSDALGQNRKEFFLIAPGFKTHKIGYLGKFNIQYIDMKGEIFIEKLFENIQANISDDFASGLLGADTLRRFYEKNGLAVSLDANKKGGFDISNVKGLYAEPKGEASFRLKENPEIVNTFKDLINGNRFGKLELGPEHLDTFSLHLNSVNVLPKDIGDLRIMLHSVPSSSGSVSVVFVDGSEFENIGYEIFGSKEKIEAIAIFKKCSFTFVLKGENSKNFVEEIRVTLIYQQSESFENVTDAIDVSKLCLNIAKGTSCTLFLSTTVDGVKLNSLKSDFPIEKLEANLRFFEGLKRIERAFEVRFSKFSDYSKEDAINVMKALHYIDGTEHIQNWDKEFSWQLDPTASLERLKDIQKEESPLIIETSEPEKVVILNKTIEIGYLIMKPLNLFVVNLDEVLGRETTTVTVKSASKKISLSYRKEPQRLS